MSVKYERLYNLIREQREVVVRLRDYPQKIVVVKSGFLISDESSVRIVYDEVGFERVIEKLLALGIPHVRLLAPEAETESPIIVIPAEVFSEKNKQFALGVAYGAGLKSVTNLATGKEIVLES